MGFTESTLARLDTPSIVPGMGGGEVCATLTVLAPIVFAVRFELHVAGAEARSGASSEIGWLPRGRYEVRMGLPPQTPAGAAAELRMLARSGMRPPSVVASVRAAVPAGAEGAAAHAPGFRIESLEGTPAIDSLSWRRGHSDWFFRHFDHAATTVISYLLGDHPALAGRIIDVGCGDGITDLGIALRTQCKELVGIDPFRGFERLPGIIAENHLPKDVLAACNLRFMAEDANFLPFPDDSFDVVISWGSIEHIAGGYLQALREMKRVLRPDGLIMVAPGLFYSNIGHHLGEFSSEPFFHLKKSREEIRKLVLETPPNYMDRSGEFATNEQYFQWFTELNRSR